MLSRGQGLLPLPLQVMLCVMQPSTDPWTVPPVTGLHLDFASLITFLPVQKLSVLQSTSLCLFSPHFISISYKAVMETGSSSLHFLKIGKVGVTFASFHFPWSLRPAKHNKEQSHNGISQLPQHFGMHPIRIHHLSTHSVLTCVSRTWWCVRGCGIHTPQGGITVLRNVPTFLLPVARCRNYSS